MRVPGANPWRFRGQPRLIEWDCPSRWVGPPELYEQLGRPEFAGNEVAAHFYRRVAPKAMSAVNYTLEIRPVRHEVRPRKKGWGSKRLILLYVVEQNPPGEIDGWVLHVPKPRVEVILLERRVLAFPTDHHLALLLHLLGRALGMPVAGRGAPSVMDWERLGRRRKQPRYPIDYLPADKLTLRRMYMTLRKDRDTKYWDFNRPVETIDEIEAMLRSGKASRSHDRLLW